MRYLEDQHVLILEMPLTCPNLGQPASPDYCRTGRDKSKTGGNLFRIWLFSLTVKLNSSLKEGWPSGHHLFCDRTFLLILLILTEQFSNLTNAKISSHFISAKWHFLHRRKGSFMNHSFEGRPSSCLLFNSLVTTVLKTHHRKNPRGEIQQNANFRQWGCGWYFYFFLVFWFFLDF